VNVESRITWRFARADEVEQARLENAAVWLADDELDRLAALRDPAVRQAWLAARVVAKQLILNQAGLTDRNATTIEIVSRDAQGRGRRPEVRIAGREASWSLSISHTRIAVGAALCAVPGVCVGIDLVRDGPLGAGFLRTWFDPTEQTSVAAGDASELHRLWAIKEAVYKAAHGGEPFAPRRIRVQRTSAGRYTCTYRGVALGDHCRVDTCRCGDHLVALVAIDSEQPSRVKPAFQPSSMRRYT
jgi:phosphopantetheinyl transferase